MKRKIFVLTLLVALIVSAGLASAVELKDPYLNIVDDLGGTIGKYGGTMTVAAGASGRRHSTRIGQQRHPVLM